LLGEHTLKLEAFDGAMISQELTMIIKVIYDPPVLSLPLVNKTISVGHTLIYAIPPSRNLIRKHDSIISSPGLMYFGTILNGVFTFKPPYSEKADTFKVQVD
jgi:TRAP-type mannitol/chloroaromatic compound transport system permease large subunit